MKYKIILLVLLLISGIAAIILFNFVKENDNRSGIGLDNNINSNLANTVNITNEEKQTAFIPKVVCEGCHMSGKSSVPQAMTISPHVNGGNYCLVCHNFSHDKHPINKDVTCEKCHGFKDESIPVSGPNIVCINCHDYPNPLNKSFGNLITIHRERDISCINCHAETCTKWHKEIGKNERWEKRLVHLRTILGAIP